MVKWSNASVRLPLLTDDVGSSPTIFISLLDVLVGISYLSIWLDSKPIVWDFSWYVFFEGSILLKRLYNLASVAGQNMLSQFFLHIKAEKRKKEKQ